jgi:hypothetical protein
VTALDASWTALIIGGSVAVMVLAAIVLTRSRRAAAVTLFGRVVPRPRLWAAAAVCCGVAGLLFEARQIMPGGWQQMSLNILGVVFSTFIVLHFARICLVLVEAHANRASPDEPQAGS